jgi:hypothetical protein
MYRKSSDKSVLPQLSSKLPIYIRDAMPKIPVSWRFFSIQINRHFLSRKTSQRERIFDSMLEAVLAPTSSLLWRKALNQTPAPSESAGKSIQAIKLETYPLPKDIFLPA